jgi:zinc protease
MLMTITAAGAQEAPETTPPAPSAPRQAQLPTPQETTLKNGLRVIVVQKRNVPLVTARVLLRTGGEADPDNLAGLADLTASLLTKGTKTRTAEQIAQQVEALGATLESGAQWDASFVNLNVMASKLPRAIAYAADVVRNPTFKQDELARLREQTLGSLSVAMRQPRALGNFVVSRVLFGSGPYGHALSGTPESLQRITRDDVVAFHKRYYRPDNAILVLGGDIDPKTGFAIAEEAFGSWKAADVPPAATSQNSVVDAKPRVVVVDLPGAGQAAVFVARRGLSRLDPAYSVGQVSNAIIGGGYSSRLNQEIRVKRGLSYGAGSSFDLRREQGPFVASTQTKNESAAEVAGIIVDEMNRLATTAATADELTPRKASLIGNFGRSLETSAGLVSRIGTLAVYGLPLSDINKYISGVQGVTAADIQQFSGAHLGGSDANVVIVGDASKFLDALKKRFPNVEVVPVKELDVNSATLRKSSS